MRTFQNGAFAVKKFDCSSGNRLTAAIFVAIAVILFAWYSQTNSTYPYYFIWDMDHTTTLDTLLINSSMLPDHISNTGFGMYLMLAKTARIGQAAEAISAINLSEVKHSLNPVMATAELTGFLRAHQPFLILATGLLLAFSLCLLFDTDKWVAALGLAVIGASESFAYHASMIRTEMYSVFFWAIAVTTSIAAVRSVKNRNTILLYIISGLFLGLSFTTKVQSLFYLAATGLLVLFSSSIYHKEPYENDSGPAKSKWPMWAGLFNCLVFLVLTAAAYGQEIPAGVPTWADGFGITTLWILFFVTLFELFIWQAVLNKVERRYEWYKAVSMLNFLAFGFMLSFFLHFAVYKNPSMGWQYLLLDYKMIFLRDTAMFSLKDLGTYLPNFILYVKYNPVMFAVLCILNVVVISQYHYKRVKRQELVLTLLITAVLLVNILIGTRYILRDILWKEIIVNFWILFLTAYILKNSSNRNLLKFAVMTVSVLMVSNISHSLVMPGRIDANYNLYGWRQEIFFGGVYNGNQKVFGDLIKARYNDKTLWEAKRQAEDYRKIRRTAEFVFINQDITLRNIGIVCEGFGICATDPGWRLESVPQELSGAMLVDSGGKTNCGHLLKEKYITQNHEYMDKFEDNRPPFDEKAILDRSDLAIFLFAPESDINGIVSHNIVKTPLKITAAKGNGKIEFTGAYIKHYASIPLKMLGCKYFFVLRKI